MGDSHENIGNENSVANCLNPNNHSVWVTKNPYNIYEK